MGQLKQANPNYSGATGRAFGAASNLVGVFGTLATDPQLRGAPDGGYLLYRLVASWMRRLAVAMALVALLFGSVAGWSGVRYLDVHAKAAATDTTIVRVSGSRSLIPARRSTAPSWKPRPPPTAVLRP